MYSVQFNYVKNINIIMQLQNLSSSYKTETLPTKQLCLPPSTPPGNHHSTFYEFDSLRYLMEVKSCSVFLFVTGLFHLA